MFKMKFFSYLLAAAMLVFAYGCLDNGGAGENSGAYVPPAVQDPNGGFDDTLNLAGDGANGMGGAGLNGGTSEIPGDSGMPTDGNFGNTDGWTPIEGVEPIVIYFAFDSDVINAQEQQKLDEMSKYMAEYPEIGLIIEGNCDDRGTVEYNRVLGERRALSLKQYLGNLNVNGERIKTISYGKDRPAVEGTSEEARALNRRGVMIPAKTNN